MKIKHIFKDITTDNLQGIKIPYTEQTAGIYISIIDIRKGKKCK